MTTKFTLLYWTVPCGDAGGNDSDGGPKNRNMKEKE